MSTSRIDLRRALPGRSRTRRAESCRRKFLRFFPAGFEDETYLAWERGYKWAAHQRWESALPAAVYRALLREERFAEIAARAVQIESRTNLLFSFEKMALRDAVRSAGGARLFATGLYDLLHGRGDLATRFQRWCEGVAGLPRRQTRVLTWPVVTVFGFLAQPDRHIYLKPSVTRAAAAAYGYDLPYRPTPGWEVYEGLLRFAASIRSDVSDLGPRDLIDVQSFLWVQGSAEYE